MLRKEDLELRRKEPSQKEDMTKMLAQQQQQTQLILCQCLQRAEIRKVKYPQFYPSKCCYWKFDREKVLRKYAYFRDVQ